MKIDVKCFLSDICVNVFSEENTRKMRLIYIGSAIARKGLFRVLSIDKLPVFTLRFRAWIRLMRYG